jgi:hypothetical protein
MQISKRLLKGILCTFGMLLFLAPLTVLAQTKTKVVVIPLGDDAVKVNPLKNVITVAKANGNFSDPVAAVNSITDVSAANPYLVVIGPGIYTITHTLQMKPYVDIVGSGENVTRLTGAISTGSLDVSSAIISGANNCTLSSLTVENTGSNSFSIALYNSSVSPWVNDVTATASGGTYNYGVFNYSGPSPTMTDVIATASGGTSNIGVYNFSSYPAIRRSTMKSDNYSLYSSGGTATVSQSTLIGSVFGGTSNTCVACDNGSGTALGANCN